MIKPMVMTCADRAQALAVPPHGILTSSPPVARSRKIEIGSVELSPRQAEVLEAIRFLHKVRGIPPTRSELVRHLKLKSGAAVDTHIQTLAARGWVATSPGSQRGLILRREGAPVYEPKDLRRTPAHPNGRCEPPPEPAWIDYDLLWEVFGSKPDLCLRIRGDAMDRAGLTDGGLVALARGGDEEGKRTIVDGDIVAVRTEDDVVLRRVQGVGATTLELRPESTGRKHRTVRFDSRTDDVEIIGVVIGRMLAGAG